jgi:F-type H+-transporting ATPase subunit b
MPQLDVSTYLPQIVWLAITFIALYVLMARVGLPAVGAMLDQRRNKISDDFDKAEQMKTEAEAVMAAYERALAEARVAAQETLRQAMEKLNAEAAERRRETTRELQQEIAAAEQRIAAARAATLVDLRSVATEVARATARKLTGIEVGAEDARVTVDAILHEYA